MPAVKTATVLAGFRLRLKFDDGFEGVVDLSELVKKGVFRKIADETAFARVHVGDHGGLEWDGDLDLCPDALYLEASGKTVFDLFPNLKRETSRA